MATRKKYARKTGSKNDGAVQGVENKHLDNRILYSPLSDWNAHIVYSEEFGVPMISLDNAEHIMIENENLREALYVNQNMHYNITIDNLIQKFIGNSTSQVNKTAEHIEIITNGAIKKQDAFRIVYSILCANFNISFQKLRPNESKLQYCWRIGALPIVSMLMFSLNQHTMFFRNISVNKTMTFYKEILDQMNKMHKKHKKIKK